MEIQSVEPLEIEEFSPPADAWTATSTRTPLLPAALLGATLLLAWRFVGVRLLRDGAIDSQWLPLLLGGVLPTIFILAYPVWAIRRAGGRVFSQWPGWKDVLLEGAIALAALFGVGAVNVMVAAAYALIFDDTPGIPEQFQELAAGESIAALVVMAVMACVWAPVAEELFFRRFVLRALTERFALPAAIALQAFIFAILHDYGGMHLTAIFVLGLAMGGLYAWRKTILTPMILHMLQNTLAVTVIGIVVLIGRLAPPLGVFGEPDKSGFRVAEVLEHSAAAEAGLQPGDVITDVEGTPIRDVMTLRLTYWLAGRDGNAELKVRRGDETLSLNVRPGAATDEMQ